MTKIPYDVRNHSFTDDMDATIAFMNSTLQQIMSRIGFSKQGFGSDLKWTAEGDFLPLAAGFFLIWGTFLTSSCN